MPVTVVLVGAVVVDIDPLRGGGEGGAAVCAETFGGGAVEGDDEIDVDGVGAGLADAVGSWEEGESGGDWVFVEEDDLFAEGFEGHADGEGGAEGVTVWSEVGEDGAGRGGVAGRGDGVEGSVGTQGHGVVGGAGGGKLGGLHSAAGGCALSGSWGSVAASRAAASASCRSMVSMMPVTRTPRSTLVSRWKLRRGVCLRTTRRLMRVWYSP